MKPFKFWIILITLSASSCVQHAKRDANSNVSRLTNQIMPLVNHLNNSDSCRKALLLIDSALAIDSDCYLCYYNKIMFLSALGDLEGSITAMDNCIRLNPNVPELHLAGGLFYSKKGDTTTGRLYFERSLAIINSVMDTAATEDLQFKVLETNKAINLLLLGDSIAGNKLLEAIVKKGDGLENNSLAKSLMHKTRSELMNILIDSTYSR